MAYQPLIDIQIRILFMNIWFLVNSLWVILFLNVPKFICLHTAQWFHVLLTLIILFKHIEMDFKNAHTNNSIWYHSFVSK